MNSREWQAGSMKDLTIEELKAREADILRGIAERLDKPPSTIPEGSGAAAAPLPVSRESKAGGLGELVPDELRSEYQTNTTVQAIFQFAALKGQSREGALITIAKVAVETIAQQQAMLVKALAEQTMIEPLSDEEIKSLLRAALSWRAQGSEGTTSHWTTPRSRNLALVVDRLRAEHPTLCAALGPAGLAAPADLVVHVLLGGQALCGKPGLPGEWEPGHRWVSAVSDDHGPREAANCPGCLAVAP